MKRLIDKESLVLALGAALASGFNFYSFVFLPSFAGVRNFEGFVRDNYLGGLFLFGIASSVGPFSAYVFTHMDRSALFRYFIISITGFVLIGVGGLGIANMPWSYLCLLASLFMQGAGFFLASLIRQKRILVSSGLQVLQPALFSVLVTLHEMEILHKINWSLSYFLSSFICFASFAALSDWKWLNSNLNYGLATSLSWRSILGRIIMSASFPLFFQLELILVGNFGKVNLGEYAMIQKLYASIAISLFGSIGLKMAIQKCRDFEGGNRIIDKQLIFMAFLTFCAVLLVGVALLYLGKGHGLTIELIIIGAIVAFIYTISSFVLLLINSFRPYLAFRVFIFSLAAYAAAYIFVLPSTLVEFLVLAGFMFCAHIVFFHFFYFRIGGYRVSA